MKGKITRWHDDKGYGFITAPDGKSQIFVHISAMNNRSARPAKNDSVSFDLEQDSQGRLKACNVRLAGRKSLSYTAVFAGVFLAMLCGMALVPGGSMRMVLLYLLMSTLTYLLYASDKRAAEQGRWRIPEKTLHVMALAGGWPGALIAQSQLRHKSKKQPFKAILWLTVGINIAGFLWLELSPGTDVIHKVSRLLL